jgi:hypothetical protein
MSKVLVSSFALLLGCSTIGLLLSGCPAGGDEGENPQAQPPVIVVQAPPDSVGESYAGGAWQTPGSTTGANQANNGPESEPYDVVALLREFEPHLTDAPKDQLGEVATDDLLSAFAVMNDAYLLGRMETRAPMAGDDVREIRFWLEQGNNMVTVEVKVGTTDRPCELSDIKLPETEKVVARCFWAGNALDFRIPLETIPPSIDTAQPYWVSGFQTCCSDAERNKPYDQIEGAQEVWRVPEQAAAPAAPGSVGADATPAPAEEPSL